MRLLAYERDGTRRLGVLDADDTVHDLTDALGATDVGELLAAGLGAGEAVERRVRSDGVALGDVLLRAPIARPPKIVCIGLNYHDHCREQNVEPPAYPMLFSK